MEGGRNLETKVHVTVYKVVCVSVCVCMCV